MILTLDIGNSRIKWASWEGKRKTGSAASEYSGANIEQALHRTIKAQPDRVLVACVAGEGVERAVNAWFGERLSLTPEYLRSGRSACGVTHGYDDPRQHGADRWAALLGARGLTRSPVCVVDAGTAVTIDWMDANGMHQGGLILPGLRVMREALARAASGIPVPDSAGEADRAVLPSPVARSTVTAVEGGTLLMLKAALRNNLEDARSRFGGELEVIITGGMADCILRLTALPAMRSEPDLVHLGLLSAFHAIPPET